MTTKSRKVENETMKFVHTVKIGFVGTPEIEKAIDRYLQETLENYFLERGEKITFCYIDEINTYHGK